MLGRTLFLKFPTPSPLKDEVSQGTVIDASKGTDRSGLSGSRFS